MGSAGTGAGDRRDEGDAEPPGGSSAPVLDRLDCLGGHRRVDARSE